MKKLKIWLKIDIFGELALWHVNLLFQKTTANDDDENKTVRLLIHTRQTTQCIFPDARTIHRPQCVLNTSDLSTKLSSPNC